MKRNISKLGLAFSASIFSVALVAPVANAQDYQIDTNVIEAPAKGAAAKKAKDTTKTIMTTSLSSMTGSVRNV